MSQNTYCSPRVYIEDVGILEDISGSVQFPGSSQISQLSLTIPSIDKSESAMMNKEVKFYLNYGGDDTVPYFIGFIKDFKTSKNSVKIVAYDSRCFLGGEYAQEITLDEGFNYDGFSLGQFIHKHTNDNLNTDDKTYMDLSLLNDTNPPVPLKGVYGTFTPYSLVLDQIKLAVDDSDIFNIFDYEIGVSFSNRGSSIHFIKQQKLDESCMSFSYGNGIADYKYTTNKLGNRSIVGNVVVDLHSTNSPRISVDVEDKLRKNFDNKAKIPTTAFITKEALKAMIHSRKNKYKITLDATKGHYIQLGNVITLNVDEVFKGNHRVTAKKVSFNSNTGVQLTLTLTTKPLTMSFNY